MAWNFAVLWFQVQVVDETNDANIDLVLLTQASGRPWLANSHNLRKQQFEVFSIFNTQTPFVRLGKQVSSKEQQFHLPK